MKLVKEVDQAIWSEYRTYKDVRNYIDKWHIVDHNWNDYQENFEIKIKANNEIDLLGTLHNMDGETLLKIAIDIGVDTPDFIPSIPTFKNELKAGFETACATFERALKQVEDHPDVAISLANSSLESILKEIFSDDRIMTKPKAGKTLYDLSSLFLKEIALYPSSQLPAEIKTIGSSLLAICQSIEKLRSEKTLVHGKTKEDYVIEDPLYTYFIVNSISTVGLFFISYYKKKLPHDIDPPDNNISDDLPF